MAPGPRPVPLACLLLAGALLGPPGGTALPLAPAAFEGRFDGYAVTEPGFAMVALGAADVLQLADDNVSEALDLGFSSRFFDDPVSQFWVASNGFVSLFRREPAGCCEGQALPDPADPDGLLAGFWTDLDPGAGGEVRVQRFASLARPGLAAQPGVVAEWRDVPGPGGGRNTFQVVFLADGAADLVVAEAHVPVGVHATIGAEDHDGSTAVTVLRGQALDLAERAWRLTPVYTPLVPDLAIESVEVERPLRPDLPWTIGVAMRNIGEGPIVQARVALTATPAPGPLRGAGPGCPELVGTRAVFDLGPGEAAEVAFAWPAPVSLAAPAVPRVGEFRFDAAGAVLQAAVPERELGNNAASGRGVWLAADFGGTDPFCQPLPAASLAAADPAEQEAYLLAADAGIVALARYHDGLGSTKFSFLMWTGNTGGTTHRLESGAVCTEWHGTFTQLALRATAADGVEAASYEVRSAAAAVPPEATGAGAGGFLLDLAGGPGFLAGDLGVCDHPGSIGTVSFSGATAPMFAVRGPIHPGLAWVHREGA